jgi:predicted transposase/invertase (TIGR01784 family)
MLTAQLRIGEKYVKMKKVVSIVILDYDLIEDSEYFHNKYMLYDAQTKSLFTGIVEIHTLELSKLPAEATEAEIDAKTARQILWLRLIKAEGEEEVKMLATKDPEIKAAYGVLKKLSASERVRLLYESREKAIWDEQARLYGATMEGFEKGLKEGHEDGFKEGHEGGFKEGREDGFKEGKLEMAKTLLASGVSPDIIAQGSGLSYDDIQSLMKK